MEDFSGLDIGFIIDILVYLYEVDLYYPNLALHNYIKYILMNHLILHHKFGHPSLYFLNTIFYILTPLTDMPNKNGCSSVNIHPTDLVHMLKDCY